MELPVKQTKAMVALAAAIGLISGAVVLSTKSPPPGTRACIVVHDDGSKERVFLPLDAGFMSVYDALPRVSHVACTPPGRM